MKFLLTIFLLILLQGGSRAFAQEDIKDELNTYFSLKSSHKDIDICKLFKSTYFEIEELFESEQLEITTLTKYISLTNDFLKHCENESFDLEKDAYLVGLRDLWLPMIFRERGSKKFEKEDFYGAKKDYLSSIAIQNEWNQENESNASTYYNIGVCHLNLGDVEDGCLMLSKAGELGMESAFDLIKKQCK